MNNRELLELAAKAAGMEGYEYSCTDQGGYECMAFDEGGRNSDYWNPLDDDGDALRLAVKVDLCISQWPRHAPPDVMVGYRLTSTQGGGNWIEEYGADPCAATRRAIVCAAAEIGKAMP